MELAELKRLAAVVRRDSLAAIFHARSGHPGGCLSAAELLAGVGGHVLSHYRGSNPREDRDRFVLSKGHACPALYAVAAYYGLLPREALAGLRKQGALLQGHPHALATPFVETSTGSLGQGFSFALGLALGARHRGYPSRIFAMLGDGELQEGQVWEAAMCAAHAKLGKLVAMIDYNKMQSDDLNENIVGLEPLCEKFAAFGWQVVELDGHDPTAIDAVLSDPRQGADQPLAVIAHTVKGKGVSFMEGSALWHGSVTLKREELEVALADLDTPRSEIERYVDGSIWQ
jgi:transketolase